MAGDGSRALWVTAARGGVDHAVAQVDLATCSQDRDGRYRSVCGDRFLPAAMTAHPGAPCIRCGRYLRARATLRGFDERLGVSSRHRRPSIVAQFLSAVLHQSPADSSRPTRGASPGGSVGHARRDLDAPIFSFPSGSRRVSTTLGRAS